VCDCTCAGVHKTFRFKLPAVRRRTDRRRGVSDGRGPPPAGHSDLDSRASSLDESVPLQPFSPFVDRLRPPTTARTRPNHDPSTTLGADPLGGPGMTEAGRVQAWRCSQGSLRGKQSSSVEEAAGEAPANGHRLSPAPPHSTRHEPGDTFSSNLRLLGLP